MTWPAAAPMSEAVAGTRSGEPWWRATWTLSKGDMKRLTIAFAAVVTAGVLIGLMLYRVSPSNAVIRVDRDIADWFVGQRTDQRTSIASWGARLSDTPVKIVASALAVAIVTSVWKRWREALLIAVSLTFEASAFIVISFIVGRERPDVERLLDSPVNTSFPSGHVAAATVYGAFAVIVFWHSRSKLARSAAVVACAAVALIVSIARMYQGMHYFTDVVGGVVLGIVSLVICARIVGAPADAVGRPLQSNSPVTV